MQIQTFNGVRLGQLRAVLEQGLREGIPFLIGRHAQVDMGRGEVVGVELDGRLLVSAAFPG